MSDTLQAFVPSLAAAGPRAIILVARRAEKLREVVDAITKSRPDVETLVVPTDISDPTSVTALSKKRSRCMGMQLFL